MISAGADFMKMSKEQYAEYVKKKSPASHFWADMAGAFLVGGAICVLGQLITALWAEWGLNERDAATACSMTLIFLGALLTGIGVYDKIAKVGGAGSLVPITGFANAVASPALEFKSEGMVTGMAAKMFLIAGPVIVYGVTASVLYGLVLWICGMV